MSILMRAAYMLGGAVLALILLVFVIWAVALTTFTSEGKRRNP